ncbi:hypothetical protein [Staphylococcus simulans]|uniref:hypothetical protein n=1 Tax=Staphylococcus simulans TaxID=1286 RepID=UPI0021D24195|nr:hypothetical protein [Staphylococcus simulans]UXV43728.1 hypothetical protein MUA12_13415 [Staphylococcus simulans]
MNSKTKIFSLFVVGTATLTFTLAPFNEIKASEISYPNSENIVLEDGKSSLSQAENFIHADKSSKKYVFDKERFMDKTNATSEEINKIESDLQTTNYDIKNTKNIKYENGKFVRYVNSEEENEMLEEQGLKANDNTENSSTVTTFAAKKGGVTKVTIGKDGGIDIYLSHKFATTLIQGGVTAAATAIGGLSAGIGAAVAGAFASQLINAYAGKAVPKNGIIMYGKPHGSENITFAPQ